MNMLITLLTNALLATALTTLAFWLPQTNTYTEKLGPYECGFDPVSSARLPFSMKFFLVAITFLLFDLEIALLLPLPWAAQAKNLMTMLPLALMLMALLALGLVYEWYQGGLEWSE